MIGGGVVYYSIIFAKHKLMRLTSIPDLFRKGLGAGKL